MINNLLKMLLVPDWSSFNCSARFPTQCSRLDERPSLMKGVAVMKLSFVRAVHKRRPQSTWERLCSADIILTGEEG